jgi:CBS domain containing-hemolysin-like protein
VRAGGRRRGRGGAFRHHGPRGLVLGGLAFLVAIFVSLPAQAAVQRLGAPPALGLVALLVIVGVLGDLVGVAAAAADEPSLHAMAAKRLPGARAALHLKRRADRVTSVAGDIVGDIASTISAAAGAAIALRVAAASGWPAELTAAVAIGGVAGLTVGGKAFVKGLALRHANRVLYAVGYVWRWFLPGSSGRQRRPG